MYESQSKKLIRINVMNTGDYQTVGVTYTGFIMFGKKSCGNDFLKATEDGRVTFDIYAETGAYTVPFTYYRDDSGTSSLTVQFTKTDPGKNQSKKPFNHYSLSATETSWGNAKKDQFWLNINGLDQVNFGAKDITECLEGAQVGAAPYTETDVSRCVGWQKTLWN